MADLWTLVREEAPREEDLRPRSRLLCASMWRMMGLPT